MSTDKDFSNTEVNEIINPDGSVIPEIDQEEQQSQSENDSRVFLDIQFQKIIFLLLRKY